MKALPPRIYERHGVRDYSIGHKGRDGKWTFRLRCPAGDPVKIAALRAEAIALAGGVAPAPAPIASVAPLIVAWFAYQDAMPESAEAKRAASTMAENRREANRLLDAFGHRLVRDLAKPDAYAYLDQCVVDGRPAKGNKEIALLRLILEYGVRRGVIQSNPFAQVQKLPTRRTDRLVTDAELELALKVGRRCGGPRHIVAMAMKTAWLCLRRSTEVRSLDWSQITADGIVWTAAKRQKGQAVRQGLIEWSDELRATIEEARKIPRHRVASWYVFGNLAGQPYSKSSWGKVVASLMRECVAQAQREHVKFRPFSLQDCRPKGVTDKMAAQASDVMDATMHSSPSMIQQTYDRRRLRVAKPVR